MHAHIGMCTRRPVVHVRYLSTATLCNRVFHWVWSSYIALHRLANELQGSVCEVPGTNTPVFLCEFWACELRLHASAVDTMTQAISPVLCFLLHSSSTAQDAGHTFAIHPTEAICLPLSYLPGISNTCLAFWLSYTSCISNTVFSTNDACFRYSLYSCPSVLTCC